jgi:hypothetical protein
MNKILNIKYMETHCSFDNGPCSQEPAIGSYLVNDELRRIWKEAIVTYFKVLFQNIPGGEALNKYEKFSAIIARLRAENVTRELRNGITSHP